MMLRAGMRLGDGASLDSPHPVRKWGTWCYRINVPGGNAGSIKMQRYVKRDMLLKMLKTLEESDAKRGGVCGGGPGGDARHEACACDQSKRDDVHAVPGRDPETDRATVSRLPADG